VCAEDQLLHDEYAPLLLDTTSSGIQHLLGYSTFAHSSPTAVAFTVVCFRQPYREAASSLPLVASHLSTFIATFAVAMVERGSLRSTQHILSIFKEKLGREWRRETVCRSGFIDTSKLTEWMLSSEDGHKTTNVGRLLQEVNEKSVHRAHDGFRDTASESILYGDDRCLLVFSVLLQIGHGDLVDLFQIVRINDHVLSYADRFYNDLRSEFGRQNIQQGDRIIEQFERAKWSYCPALIKLYKSSQFPEGQWILPFAKMEKITEKGGTAGVWQVLIQKDCIVSENPNEGLDALCGSKVRDPSLGHVSVQYQCAFLPVLKGC
jgi:hypothetical protein